MKYPTKEQIIAAASTSKEARIALQKLFPEILTFPVQPGQVYEWGTDSDGGSGVVVDMGASYSFINFHSGKAYLQDLPKDTNKYDLNRYLGTLRDELTHHCYKGEIRGPKHFRSWCLK